MNIGKLAGEGLGDALAFSALERLLQDRSSRQLVMGQYLLERGKLAAAELCFEQAIRESNKEPHIATAALIGKAEIYKRRKSFAEAHEALAAVQDLAATLNDPKLLGLVYQQQAEIASAEDRPAVALEKLKEAQQLFASIAEATVERVQVALKVGLIAQQLFRLREALTHYEEAEQFARDLGSDKGALKLLSLVGQANVLLELGRCAEALRKCTQAEELLSHDAQSSAQFSWLVAGLKAACCETRGDPKAAAENYERALAHAPDMKERARLCAQLAVLKFSMGCPQEARKHEEQALTLLNEQEIPEALLNLSQLNLMRGQVHTAETQFVRAVVELSANPENKPDKRREIALKLHHASLDLQKGMIRSASDRAATVYEELLKMTDGDVETLLLSVLQTMGNIARLQGRLDEADELYKKALDIAERLGMPMMALASLSNLAQVAAARFEMPVALEYLEKATRISQGCGAALYQRSLLVDRITLLNRQGNLSSEEALARLEELLGDSVHLECLPLELTIRMALGGIYWEESHYEKAAKHAEETMEKAAQAGLEFTKVIAQGWLGSVLADQGEKTLAEHHLGEAIAAMEKLGLEIEAKHEFRERYRSLTGFWF